MAIAKKKKIHTGQVVLGIVLGAYALFCLLPVLLSIIASFTDQVYIE